MCSEHVYEDLQWRSLKDKLFCIDMTSIYTVMFFKY